MYIRLKISSRRIFWYIICIFKTFGLLLSACIWYRNLYSIIFLVIELVIFFRNFELYQVVSYVKRFGFLRPTFWHIIDLCSPYWFFLILKKVQIWPDEIGPFFRKKFFFKIFLQLSQDVYQIKDLVKTNLLIYNLYFQNFWSAFKCMYLVPQPVFDRFSEILMFQKSSPRIKVYS